jgi:hypothetical protein
MYAALINNPSLVCEESRMFRLRDFSFGLEILFPRLALHSTLSL